MRLKTHIIIPIYFALLVLIQACSSTKYVPDGKYLLDDVHIESNIKNISYFDLSPYIKQSPNFKTFMLFKMPLKLYSLSGRDTTKFYNRWLKNIGEAPVIYDTTFTHQTEDELRRYFVNLGYLNADVQAKEKFKSKKVDVTYMVHHNKPFIITNYAINLPDSIFNGLAFSRKNRRHSNGQTQMDSISLLRGTLIKKKMAFNLNVLDEERERVATIFRQNGYFAFSKDYIGFVADTLAQKNSVGLEMVFYKYNGRNQNDSLEEQNHRRYKIKTVKIYLDYDPLVNGNLTNYKPTDSLKYDGCTIYWGANGRYIKPSILMECIFLRPGRDYDDKDVNYSYSALSRLDILRNVNIKFIPFTDNDSTSYLNAYITCFPDKRQGFVTEIEGTNTFREKGYLGAAASLSYHHRNIFKGSELFNVKIQGGFDAISATSLDFKNNFYELGGEASLTFPRFLAPFLSRGFKRKSRASTQLSTNYTYQQFPPYYKRSIMGVGLKYIWQDPQTQTSKQTLDLLDISYAHFPYLSKNFYDSLPEYTKLYGFQDLFIAGMGYTITNTNFNPLEKAIHPIHSFRASVETAGNSLDLLAKAFKIGRDSLGLRKIFGTYYAQYIKLNVDYSKTFRFDLKNSFAWHIGSGIAVPYGNSKAIPFQKRFYSGGANSLRGWGVRELGPGSYNSSDATFYNHSGDIRLDANAEYRSKIFWKFELAAFLDAGNIWTIRNYEDQPDGVFKLNSFYKQIAASWGLGLRLDFDFVLLRLDFGWKAYNPSDNTGRTKWQVLYPLDFSRNMAWNIAVGYPF